MLCSQFFLDVVICLFKSRKEIIIVHLLHMDERSLNPMQVVILFLIYCVN